MLKLYKDNKPLINLNELQKNNIQIFNQKILAKNYNLVKTKCPICLDNKKNQSYEVISNKDRFGINVKNIICENCGLIRNLKCLDEESLKNFYKNEYRKIYTGKISTDQNHLEKVFLAQYETGKKYYELIKKYINKSDSKNILEIGCSSGGTLSYFKEKGFNILGLDYDESYINFGKNKNLNLEFGSIEKVKSTKFDVIILSHVFEHIHDLKFFIESISTNLVTNGLIFIAVPGIYHKEYYSIRHIRRDYKRIFFLYYLQNAHIYSFSKKTLSNFFKFSTNKFKVLHIDEEINCILKLNNNELSSRSANTSLISSDYLNFKMFYYINYIKFVIISLFFKN